MRPEIYLEFDSKDACFGLEWVRSSTSFKQGYNFALPLRVTVFSDGFFAVVDTDKNRVLYADTGNAAPPALEAQDFVLSLAYTLL